MSPLSAEHTLAPELPAVTPSGKAVTLNAVVTAYRRLAPVYDWLFGACFRPGQRSAVATLAPRAGERVLEVGVGTGLTLPHWPAHTRVTGIDISPEMLRRAEEVRQRHRLEHVDLRRMDAQSMQFPDNSFEKVAALYIVSVTPDLNALLGEIRRVCVPGGAICIVNHFEQTHPIVRRIERSLSAHAAFLGFNTALPIRRVMHFPGLKVRQSRSVNWGGYWSLLELENVK